MLIFKKHLLDLKDRIPEIKEMEVGININPSERSFDAVLVSTFESLEDLNSYSANPLHVAVSDFCKTIRTQSASVDYEF